MDAAAIQLQIEQYQLRKSALETENTALTDKIQRLNTALTGYKKKYDELETCLAHEKMRGNEFRWVSPVKAASSYADILSGLSYQQNRQKADDAFTNITNKITKQINQFEEEEQANTKTIALINAEITYLRTRMLSLM